MTQLDPDKQRRFAVEVVRSLRAGGFQAYWAGGCVRDQLLQRIPKDYDVATDATPQQISDIFARRRTLQIGAAFGVVVVVGPRRAGQIDVATFRRDAQYSDGRHPDSITFSTPEDDAERRDFTINGLFFDPLDERVIDFVGGQEDLKRKVVRAIGPPEQRIAEDKLRMLRAVRFAATLEFELDLQTRQAIRQMAAQLTLVSAERIAAEMRLMLEHARRTAAVRLLAETGLLTVVLPEVDSLRSAPSDQSPSAVRGPWEQTLLVLDALHEPSFPQALAALVHAVADDQIISRLAKRWRLSTSEQRRAAWLVRHQTSLASPQSTPWPKLQRLLTADGVDDLLALHQALSAVGVVDASAIEYCREKLRQPPAVLDPPPILTGDDLIRHGVPRGKAYSWLLRKVRDAQLENQIRDQSEALKLVDQLLAQPTDDSQHDDSNE